MHASNVKKILTIAGSDSSGGAGIQADIKTIAAHHMYAMSAITALTAQNTTGVTGILDATPEFVAAEIDAVFADIRPDAVKIGMVSQVAIIEVIAARLREHKAENIVVDPVMVATSGSRLLAPDAIGALTGKLFPLATLLTPNIPEAELLTGRDDMLRAAEAIRQQIQAENGKVPALLLKGGHLSESADDLLDDNGSIRWFHAPRIDNPNTHGTGCTLSSAIACNLAKGLPLSDAVQNAKDYITGALKAGLNLGQGSGPLWHDWQSR